MDGSQRAIVWRYFAPIVEDKALMDAKQVRFFSHWARLRPLPQCGLNLWARLRPLPQRGLNLGRGYDLFPSVEWTLGETGSCQGQPCSQSLKEQCQPYHELYQLLLIRGANVIIEYNAVAPVVIAKTAPVNE